MIRIIFPAVLAILFLSSCDKLLKLAKVGSNRTIADELRITSESKPEIIAAFEAISKATQEHNRVFLKNHDAGKPANEMSYSAGIDHLRESAREHGGLAKQVIEAVAATCAYEKSLFTPFDTIGEQLEGMPTWSNERAVQLRGYIHIMDRVILTFDGAVAYLERGEQPLQQRNFDKYKVPAEVSAEFFRLGELYGKEVTDSKLGMFREQRSALQYQRDALTTADPARIKEFEAKAKEHQQLADQYEARMISAVRSQMDAAGAL